MGKLAIQLLFLITFFLVLVSHILPITSQEVGEQAAAEDEREFNYDPYSEKGPAHWGRIRPEWSACSNGTMQSPIDLLNEIVDIVPDLGRLNRSYKPGNAILKNRGHDIMLKWESGAGIIEINGTEYVLNQCHWHSPSEHTIDGERFALELHMVHESLDGKIAVVGILYKIGRPDSFLSSLTKQLEYVAGTTERDTVVGVVDPRNIKIGSRKYYRYLGSLTTPPCTENVVWTVVKKVRTVTKEQVQLLRVAVHDDSDTNARPLQPLNGRTVKLFIPEDKDD
ncbi:alpha carbonic anhydrase 7-like [Populus alba x Populus x berolinensis]|uniref:Carbonic anhydrase n=1 Tax=Populus alba x Populus x berolinensis TaxID=444605 RepID=A0AAD6W7T2_9ROSI|nr:alpha carbonic anhydrase 7-like [Populus alba x Populus x berolinensis]KAJ7001986.1 alpha carbonic anhydrase 7-like [Populus alba x Populus x berolinensis]